MKKKICFFSGVISRSGGTERVGIMIANELANKGYDVSILSFWNDCKPFFKVNEKIKIDYLLDYKEGKLYRTYIYPILKLRKYIKSKNIDILIDIDTLLSKYSGYAVRGTKCKLVSWEHFNYYYMLKDNSRIKAKKIVKKVAEKLVVLTKEDKEAHIENMGFDCEKIEQIYNPSPFEIKNEYNFENKNFVAVGRLTEQKGFDFLIKAWKIFEERNKEWTLTIVGDGEEKENLEELSKDANNIKFVGKTDNVEMYYKQASCYVLSSRYEGFPMVILEAQSFALPVIAYDCKTGPKEMVFDNENGYLVESSNVEKLAETMIKFVNEKSKAEEMSKKSIEYVSSLSIKNIGQEWENLIKKILFSGGKNENTKN